MHNKIHRPDSKGRITLGQITKGVSGFRITETEDNCYKLEPLIEIPAREKWLFTNKSARKRIHQVLDDAKHGRTESRTGFSQLVDDEES